MPEWERRGEVLVVYGSELHANGHLDTLRLRAFLGASTSPVRLGTHDFWVVHPYPPGGGPAHFHGDPPLVPPTPALRPHRGILRMQVDLAATLDQVAVALYMQAFAHEVGHHWLVPAGLALPQGPLDGPVAFLRDAGEGRLTSPLSLYGRAGHWSAYLQADASNQDGIGWTEEAVVRDGAPGREEGRLRRFAQRTDTPPIAFETPGVPDTSCLVSFNDLELYLMGVLAAGEAYPRAQGGFDSLVPVWMQGPNLHAGLALVFDRHDVVLFGFARGIGALGVWRTDGAAPPAVSLDGVHAPWRNSERMLLRVVRRGARWAFQAKPDDVAAGCASAIRARLGLRGPPPEDPLDAAGEASPPGQGPWTGWRTVATLDDPRAPLALGYMVTTWGVSPIALLDVRPLLVGHGTQRREVLRQGETVTGPDYADALRDDAFTLHLPVDGFTVRPRTGGYRMHVVPTLVRDDEPVGIGPATHAPGVDRAPKLLVRPPPGDFVAAGSVRLERVLMEPWAGGEVGGMTLWAYRHRFPVRDLHLPPDVDARRRTDGAYRAAFIVVAPDRQALNLLGLLPPVPLVDPAAPRVPDAVVANADRLRVASEGYFRGATRGRSALHTRLG